MPPTALHIGAHKTGTTHLQKSFMAVRPALVAQGIQFYGPTMLRKDGRSLKSRLDNGRADKLRRGDDRLVISEENLIGSLYVREGEIPRVLYRQASDRIAQFSDVLAPDGLDVFMCIRDPASFLSSAYGQVLMGGMVKDASSFVAENPLARADWVYLARRVAKAPGVRRLVVWRYEDYGALFHRIAGEMLGASDLVSPVAGKVHQGLSARAVAAVHEWAAAGETGPLAILARETFPISGTTPAFAAYTDTAASASMYHEQQAKIARIPNVQFLLPDAKA